MENSEGSSSTPEIVNGENRKPESSSPTGKPPSDRKAKQNIMLERLQNYVEPPLEELGRYTYEPKPFFFYGTLTDPLQLQEVLKLPAPPVLKTARAQAHKIMLWGQYPALVRGPSGRYVDGVSYFIEADEQQKMLRQYETKVYDVAGIRIVVKGERVSGRTFMRAKAGDLTGLTEGT
ncbi:uncharacterized protein PAC_08845 [Phialocephala subalpina]|uniref:Gamma-glutamylcyclotransferase AIG2-like domain-containing protein n=1 Tax=Phialocephala subalpina TaxID=576137 RepID=A0A1L7X1P4_9HELO|nr:uncharacterized protein PAC_08845 [Phialocephala subalpina]